MAYTAWSVVFGEQPTAAKWNQLGENDAGFKNGDNIDDDAIIQRHLAAQAVGAAERKEVLKVGKFTTTGNGNKAVTGVGFTPKGLILMEFDSIHQSASVANFVVGMTDGTTSGSIGFRAQEGGDISGQIDINSPLFLPASGQGKTNEFTFVSFDADGFTLSLSNYSSNMDWMYMAFA